MTQPASQLPDDFGYGPIETLSHVEDPSPSIEHTPCWNRWDKVVHAEPRPVLTPRRAGASGIAEPDPSDETVNHAFESLGVRIGARLLIPERGTAIRGALVRVHGYAASNPLAEVDAKFKSLLAMGVAVLSVRVRGYAGSRLDCGDLTRTRGGWICQGLDSTAAGPDGFLDWIYPARWPTCSTRAGRCGGGSTSTPARSPISTSRARASAAGSRWPRRPRSPGGAIRSPRSTGSCRAALDGAWPWRLERAGNKGIGMGTGWASGWVWGPRSAN